MSRHMARERALQTLFQMDINQMDSGQAAAYTQTVVSETVGENAYDLPYFNLVLNGVLKHQTYIDAVLNRYSEDWLVSRMPGVDRNVLRISAYELIYENDLPVAVAIDEAVSLCKDYGTEHSAKFVNGVLSGVLKDLSVLRERSQGTSP